MRISATTTKTWRSRAWAIAPERRAAIPTLLRFAAQAVAAHPRLLPRDAGNGRGGDSLHPTLTLIATLLLFLVPMSHAADQPSAVESRIDALMNRYHGDVPGASLLVLRDGRALLRKSYGLSNLEEHVAATPATNYRLASVTKQFTAASILLLAEDGKLSLDDPLRKWLPTLPPVADAMTIRQVLSHMSGLIDYEDVIAPTMTAQLHDADVLKILESQNRTYFAPGSSYRYSNSGYSLLALIVGKSSGKDFATFLKERIFQPLGMTHTVAFEQGISTVENRAFGYSEENGRWIRTDQSQTSAVLGDGGIYSSTDDLAKWDAALYDSTLLSVSSRQLAFTPVTGTDDPTVRYAMGWRVTPERVGGSTLWHSGETMGFRNVIIRYPQHHFTVILLTNRNDPEPYQTARSIAQLVLTADRP